MCLWLQSLNLRFWVPSRFWSTESWFQVNPRTPPLRNWTNERKTKIWLGRPTLNAVMANFVCGANPKSRNSWICESCEFLSIENKFWHNPRTPPLRNWMNQRKTKIWFGRPSKTWVMVNLVCGAAQDRIQSVAVRNPLTDLPKPLMCRTRYHKGVDQKGGVD